LINNDEFRQKLFDASSSDELYELLKTEEEKLFS